MLINRIEGATHTLGKPQDWDDEQNGRCGSLPIRAEQGPGGLIYLCSSWQPTPEELQRLAAGAPVILRIVSTTHPPEWLSCAGSVTPSTRGQRRK